MDKELVVRVAQRADAEEIDHLYKHSIRCNKQGFIQDFSFHGSLWKRSREWRAAGGELLVGRISNALAGIGALSPINSRVAEICKLHVSENFQRRGIGEAIVLTLMRLAESHNFKEVQLHVTQSQQSAIRLYQRLGFEDAETVPYKTTVFGVERTFETLYMSKKIASA
ncbi:MAG: GNAT family N-acetyltransferase [Pseudomonadota bacterium]